MTTTTEQNVDRVPFSPIPTGPDWRMKFNPDDTWDYTANPIAVAWERAYKRAAWNLLTHREDEARAWAKQGIALEDAYMKRVRNESRASDA